MANERLRRAMTIAHVDVSMIADATGVDPKTVQRWVSGRIPHPRHRWAIAKALNEREDYLWPSEHAEKPANPGDQTAEIIAAYGHRSDFSSAAWWQLFVQAQHQIDLLGYAMHFLPEQLPDLMTLLKEKSAAGCHIRIAIGDPTSPRIRDRDKEENLGGTLPARIRSTLHHFQELWDCVNVEIRYHTAPLYNSVFQFDDEMCVTPHLYSVHGSKAPLLHLRRLGPSGLFADFAMHFKAIWETTKPAERTQISNGTKRRTA